MLEGEVLVRSHAAPGTLHNLFVAAFLARVDVQLASGSFHSGWVTQTSPDQEYVIKVEGKWTTPCAVGCLIVKIPLVP